jgi:hypothetical protein
LAGGAEDNGKAVREAVRRGRERVGVTRGIASFSLAIPDSKFAIHKSLTLNPGAG